MYTTGNYNMAYLKKSETVIEYTYIQFTNIYRVLNRIMSLEYNFNKE